MSDSLFALWFLRGSKWLHFVVACDDDQDLLCHLLVGLTMGSPGTLGEATEPEANIPSPLSSRHHAPLLPEPALKWSQGCQDLKRKLFHAKSLGSLGFGLSLSWFSNNELPKLAKQ